MKNNKTTSIITLMLLFIIACEKQDNTPINSVECLLTKLTHVYQEQDNTVLNYEYDNKRRLVKSYSARGNSEIKYGEYNKVAEVYSKSEDSEIKVIFSWTDETLITISKILEYGIWKNNQKYIYELNEESLPKSVEIFFFKDNEWILITSFSLIWEDGNIIRTEPNNTTVKTTYKNSYYGDVLQQFHEANSITINYEYDDKKNAYSSLIFPHIGLWNTKNNISKRYYSSNGVYYETKYSYSYNHKGFPIQLSEISERDGIQSQGNNIIFEYNCID